jgi:tRNA-splicing ligase RtcB
MRVPGVLYASEPLIREMDDKVAEQVRNVASLPGIVGASYAMPDAHWGYGFPIGGVAAFDPDVDGVVSAGGVGFDISCGVRTLVTGLREETIEPVKPQLAEELFRRVPAGMGQGGRLHLNDDQLDAMLTGGARWVVAEGYGRAEDLERIEAMDAPPMPRRRTCRKRLVTANGMKWERWDRETTISKCNAWRTSWCRMLQMPSTSARAKSSSAFTAGRADWAIRLAPTISVAWCGDNRTSISRFLTVSLRARRFVPISARPTWARCAPASTVRSPTVRYSRIWCGKPSRPCFLTRRSISCTTSRTTRARLRSIPSTASASDCSCIARARRAHSAPATPIYQNAFVPSVSRC